MLSGLSFSDEKNEPWIYEKHTQCHTFNGEGARAQTQLDSENHFFQETKFAHACCSYDFIYLRKRILENAESPCISRSSWT